MKAIVYHRYGSPDVLQLKEVEKPTPTDDEVLIKVYAASINSWDWDLLRGRPLFFRVFSGMFSPSRKIMGMDVAGKVEAVGKNVTQFKTGDDVLGDISGCHWGGFAEYVCASEKALALKSTRMTFEEAAAVPQAAVLALQGLRQDGQFPTGKKVLINGSGGGVGTFAVQMAKSFGAEVSGVDSPKKLGMLRALGADHVIDYTREDSTRNGAQYDLILDVVGNRSLFDLKRALHPNGRYVMVGGPTSKILLVALSKFWMVNTEKKMGLLIHLPNKQDLNFINEQFESGKVKPVIDRRYSLQDTAEAFRYFGTGEVEGKVIITMGHDSKV